MDRGRRPHRRPFYRHCTTVFSDDNFHWKWSSRVKMVQIWHMEHDPCGDRRLPHHVFPPKTMTPDQLQQKKGVVCYRVNVDDTMAVKKRMSIIKTERNCYKNDSFLLDGQRMTDFLAKLDALYEPTAKKYDVVNLITDGSAYYDIEMDEEDEQWVRILAERGDLIIIPASVTHRMTTTPKNFVQMQRYWKSSLEKNVKE